MTNEDFIKSVSLEGEIWKDVVGCNGKYLVSNKGRIISLPKIVNGSYGCQYIRKIRLLSRYKDKRGYWRNNNLKGKSSLIHRIVAESFIPNPNQYLEIDHIDGNTSNCNVENLRWCTSKMNKLNPITLKRNSNAQKGKFNEKNGASKVIIAYNNVDVIKFPSINEARRKGFAKTCVYRCLLNNDRLYKGYHFMYLSDYEKSINKSKNE
jgi:hypothetical protein